MPMKKFKAKIVPMGDDHWSCIRIPFNVEQEFGSKARVAEAKRGLSLRRALCDSQGLSPALPALPSSRTARAATS
jgi:hypothetical protein